MKGLPCDVSGDGAEVVTCVLYIRRSYTDINAIVKTAQTIVSILDQEISDQRGRRSDSTGKLRGF